MIKPVPIEPIPDDCQLTTDPAMPVCLPCARHHFGMNIDLPAPPKDSLMNVCLFCQRLTNHGLYLVQES
jgi:hypothetical protein